MADSYENMEFDYTAKIAGISKKVNNLIPAYSGGAFAWVEAHGFLTRAQSSGRRRS
jgi:hypothetical protein